MLLRQVDEGRKDQSRCRGCRIEITVLDGGVDPWVGALLHSFQDRKQTAQYIGQIGALFVQFHRHDLLELFIAGIAQIVRFEDGGLSPADILLGTDAELDAIQKGSGIGCVVQNGQQQITGQTGAGFRTFGPGGRLAHGFQYHAPDRERRSLIVGRADDPQPVIMGVQVLGQLTEAVLPEKADRQPGGGQLLLCTEGRGWYQEWGQEARALRPGDAVEIPAGVKHWHGAAKGSWFSHLAVELPGEGASNEWLEAVSDEAYNALQEG